MSAVAFLTVLASQVNLVAPRHAVVLCATTAGRRLANLAPPAKCRWHVIHHACPEPRGTHQHSISWAAMAFRPHPMPCSGAMRLNLEYVQSRSHAHPRPPWHTCSLAASLPRSLAASQPRCLAASLPRCLAASWPRNIAASQPRSLAYSQPCGLPRVLAASGHAASHPRDHAASQPFRLAAWQPRSLAASRHRVLAALRPPSRTRSLRSRGLAPSRPRSLAAFQTRGQSSIDLGFVKCR